MTTIIEDQIPTPKEIIKAIQNFSDEYQKNQGLILSEADLKCHIFRIIYDLIPDHSLETYDCGITGSPLHTEINFYDKNNKLCIRPDITILQPKNLSIKFGLDFQVIDGRIVRNELPSCKFQFAGKALIIEIKFERSESGITEGTVERIKYDLEKITQLMNRHNALGGANIFGIMVIFNKTDNCVQSFRQLVQDYEEKDNLEIVYCTGNV